MDTITALIAAQRAKHPAAPALIYEGTACSYAQLEALGRRAAAGLEALGVTRGDRVALWLPNSPAYLALWLGTVQLGAVAVAVNTRFRSVEVADIVARSQARVLALWPGFRSIPFLDILAEVDRGALERLRHIILYAEGSSGPRELPDAIAHCARIPYSELVATPALDTDHAAPQLGSNMFTTSGTTKAPKFVVHTHASISRHARTVAREFGYLETRGAILQALPLCGVFGFCQASAALASGRPMVLMSAFDPEQAVDNVDRYGIEYLNATDDMLSAMFEVTSREVALPSVKHAGFASFAAEPEAFMATAKARGLKLVGLYGMSEVQAFFARQSLDASEELRRQGGGHPLDRDASVRVCDPDDDTELPVGEHGEIQLRGPSLMKEYFQNAEATAEAFTGDGYIRSGDLGYRHEAGGFVYLARMGDVLRLGGFLVSPLEIEAHLTEHPAVTGAQVVGVTTEAGPRPVGFVTLRAGVEFDENALREHCLGGLAKFKCPARIVPVQAFPTTKSANGTKIQKARLREMAEIAIVQA